MGGFEDTKEASLVGLGDLEQELRAQGVSIGPWGHTGSQAKGTLQAGDGLFSGLDTQQGELVLREKDEFWASLFTQF